MNKHAKIMKVNKNEDGEVTEVMLDNGKILPLNHAILMAKHGSLDGFHAVRGENGGEYLKIDPNDDTSDTLNRFPTFKHE